MLLGEAFPIKKVAHEKVWRSHFWVGALCLLPALCAGPQARAANRSTYIPYDNSFSSPDFRCVTFDQTHQQIFTAWPMLDRIDVLAAADYHLIRSIRVPSPLSVDISPDGTTLAVGTFSAHILFFDTRTFAKTNDLVFPSSALGVTAFVYTANGNAIIRAAEGLSTGGGITVYWDHVSNSFLKLSDAMHGTGPYSTNGPLARSGDYSRIMLGDATSGGSVQIIDGNTGQVLQETGYGGYIDALAANKDASRYAVCVEPAGLGTLLVVLNSSLDVLYQDEAECRGMAFSADGKTLYRDASVNSVMNTQSINMDTFSIKNTVDQFSQAVSSLAIWQAADATGMVYGEIASIPDGTVFVAVDTTASSTPAVPGLNDPARIVRVIDNIGSPQGGDIIRLLCTGLGTVSADSVTVTIGGVAATNLAVGPIQPSPTLPLRLVTVKTPPGKPGLVDVTLNAGGDSDTATKSFQYARSSRLFPFSTSPNFLVYDSFRQKLYAAHKDQVEVIDPISQQVLTPLVPASGKLQESQFAGLSISPDGNRLYVADTGAHLIHVLDLANPGKGTSIDPTLAVGSPTTLSPDRVFETSSGKLVSSDVNGTMFIINSLGGGGNWLLDGLGNKVAGHAWSSTNKGEHVFITTGTCGNGLMANGLISGCIALWNDAASQYTSSRDLTQDGMEADANEDGTVIVRGGSTPGIQSSFPEIVDFGLNTIGYVREHFDMPMPTGTPSFFLHPSGALLFKAGELYMWAGALHFGGLVEIDDLHQLQPAATIAFPEAFITSYSPFTDHMLATDETGRYFFGVTQSGITMMVLDTIPLSIGNLRPAFGPPEGGQTVTIRGSGFQPGVGASFGGIQAATDFVDENTLTAIVPALTSGWQDVTVTNTNGISYTSPGAFQVLGAQPTPAITGFSPAALIVGTDTPGLTVTILGSGFQAYDTVEINGQPVDSTFVDASHIQATIPVAFALQTGSIPLTVVSYYTGSSNTLSLPMVNPVPVIRYTLPESLVTGSSSTGLNVYGTGFVASSVVQWNDQSLSTYLVGGKTSDGDGALVASVPASLLTNTGTATITVLNPSPGGGISNAFIEDISPPRPAVSYPASIDFGQVLVNTAATKAVQLTNLGSANYTISSATMSSDLFSAQWSNCRNVVPVSICNLQVQFAPTTTGATNATLTITDDAPGSPHNIPVTGTGTQTLVPTVTITSVDVLGQTVVATLNGTATVGGPAVPAIAWIEYGTDRTLATYTKSGLPSFTGDSALSGSIGVLSPATTYAARLVV